MNLLRWLRLADTPPPPPPPKRARPARGSSGTINQGGFLVPHEPNPDVSGKQGLKVWDRMRRGDASVKEALAHLVEPVKNAEWDIVPASEDPLDLEVAAFVRKAYFDHAITSWHEHLSEALLFLALGHYLFEISLQVLEDELEVEDPAGGDPTTTARRQFLTLRRFEPRLPHTIWKWNVEGGELVSVEQQAFNDQGMFKLVTIPATDLLVLIHDREGDDFTGQSILRPAYKAWTMKETLERAGVVAAARFGAGIIVCYLPAAKAEDQEAVEEMETILANLDAGEQNYIVCPWPEVTVGANDGGKIEILTPGAALPDLTAWAQFHRAEIKAAVLARFAELGHAQVGARSTGDTQSTVWYNALNSVAKHLCDVHSLGPIRRLVDANYTVDRYPRLDASGIEVKNLTEFADSVSKLVAGGAIIADPPFRAWTREQLDAPEEAPPEEIVSDVQDRGGMTEADQIESEAEQQQQALDHAAGEGDKGRQHDMAKTKIAAKTNQQKPPGKPGT